MTMQTCVGCGAFLMPDWDTCKICGHDPAAPPPAPLAAEPKGRRGRRAKAPKAPKVQKREAAPAVAASLPPRPLEEPPETAFEPPGFEATAFVEPRADEPVFDEPAFAEPVFAEPVFTEPVLAEPVLAEPAFDASTLQPPSRESLAAPALLPGDPEPAPPAEPGPVRAAAGDDDDAYEEFEPNRVPMILLVLLIVVIVGYFGIYLPTRDSGDDSPLDDVPGQGDDAATTTSVAVALAEDDAHGVTVEL